MTWTILIWVFKASSNIKSSWNNNPMAANYFKICNVGWMKGTHVCENSLSPKQSITTLWLVSDTKHHKQCSGMPRFDHHGVTLSMRFQISIQTQSRSHSASEPIFSKLESCIPKLCGAMSTLSIWFSVEFKNWGRRVDWSSIPDLSCSTNPL